MSKVEYGIYIDGQYAGNIGLFDINFDKGSAQIGYWLSVDFLKRGYMSEAVRVLEENAFNHLGLHRLEISCDEDNLPSAGVIKRCSYFFEGLKRENYYNEHFGAYRSTLVFSKLSKEFNVVSH
jgi:ribosomal-protein-serine acetyltransferase